MPVDTAAQRRVVQPGALHLVERLAVVLDLRDLHGGVVVEGVRLGRGAGCRDVAARGVGRVVVLVVVRGVLGGEGVSLGMNREAGLVGVGGFILLSDVTLGWVKKDLPRCGGGS